MSGYGMDGNGYADRARRMREDFDRAFALPRPEAPPAAEDLLAIRLRGDAFALRAREIGALAAGRKLVPLPGAPSALLGLAGVRGVLVPAWDLGSLLGYGGGDPGSRWLALVPGADAWALAFGVFEGLFRVPRADIHPVSAADTSNAGDVSTAGGIAPPGEGGFSRETCAVGGCGRPVIDLAAVQRRVRELSGTSN